MPNILSRKILKLNFVTDSSGSITTILNVSDCASDKLLDLIEHDVLFQIDEILKLSLLYKTFYETKYQGNILYVGIY